MSVGLCEFHEPASGPPAREQMTEERSSSEPRVRIPAKRCVLLFELDLPDELERSDLGDEFTGEIGVGDDV